MQPINYLPQNQQSIFQQFAGGFQAASAIRQAQEAAEEKENQKKLLEQYQKDTIDLANNPSTAKFAQLALKYPAQREAIISAGKMFTEEQQNSAFSDAVKIYSSLDQGNAEAALKVATLKRDALKNANRDFSSYDSIIETIQNDPTKAKLAAGVLGASIDPKKWTETFKAAPEIEEAKSKAAQAATKAKFAESEAVLDLQKKGWDITKIQEDIKIAKENNRIAALNAQIAREGNALKREEMGIKLQELKDKRDEAIRGKTAEVESARFNIDNMLNTADRVLKNPSLNSVLGSIQGRLPAVLSDEASDAIALIDTLKSQAFLSQIPNVKGMGQLSNAEGEKLQSSFQNLSRNQSEKQFIENLKEAQRLLLKARKNISTRFGVPDTAPDTPAVQPSPQELDAILKKYGG